MPSVLQNAKELEEKTPLYKLIALKFYSVNQSTKKPILILFKTMKKYTNCLQRTFKHAEEISV
jgi:hypothetical protein